MSEPSEQAKRKASELWDEETAGSAYWRSENAIWRDALARYIQQTSDVVQAYFDGCAIRPVNPRLQSLILPDEPDPVDKFAKWLNGCSKDSKGLREAAAMFGLKIVLSDD